MEEGEKGELETYLDKLYIAVFRSFGQCCTDEEVLREVRYIMGNKEPHTCLQQQKLLWQAEILEKMGSLGEGCSSETLLAEAYTLRQQSKSFEGEL